MYRNILPKAVSQTNLFESTFLTKVSLKNPAFFDDPGTGVYNFSPLYSSTEGRPIFSGISLNLLKRKRPVIKANRDGTIKEYLQPNSTKYPPAIKMIAAPIWCEQPNMPQILPYSFGVYQ